MKIKIKKILMLFSMIAVLGSLTACGEKKQDKPFAYEEADIIAYSESLATSFAHLDDINKAYLRNEGGDVFSGAVDSFETAEKEAGAFVAISDSTVAIDEENVVVTVTAAYEERDVEITVTYNENIAAEYNEQALPFMPIEIVVSPVYSMKELMIKAASNTLMGMGTVFVVLIFISILIGLFKYIPTSEKKTAAKSTQVPKAEPVLPKETPVAPADDAELIAVITAAIVAASASEGNAVSADQLVVRSIKRVAR